MFARVLLRHCHRVRILEFHRFEQHEPVLLANAVARLLIHRARVGGGCRSVLQQTFRHGSGEFGVDVDVAAFERLVHERRLAEVRLDLHAHVRVAVLDELLVHVHQNLRFGAELAGHDNRLTLVCRRPHLRCERSDECDHEHEEPGENRTQTPVFEPVDRRAEQQCEQCRRDRADENERIVVAVNAEQNEGAHCRRRSARRAWPCL